jgi:hypothetical protein
VLAVSPQSFAPAAALTSAAQELSKVADRRSTIEFGGQEEM